MSAVDTAILARTPTLFYKLDETVGATTAVDSSGNAHHGTVAGGTFGSTGIGDGATSLTLTGSDGITVPADVTLGAGEFSILLWFKTSSQLTSSSFAVLLGTSDTAAWLGFSNGKMHFEGAGAFNATPAPGDTNWHLAVLSVTAATVSLYVDGIMQAQQAVATHNLTGQLVIGGLGIIGFFQFLGRVAKFAIFPTGLTAADAAAIYNANGNSVSPRRWLLTTPVALSESTANQAVTLAGIGTDWVNNPPTFTVSGTAGATKVSQSVTDALNATVTVTTGATPGTVVISDGEVSDILTSGTVYTSDDRTIGGQTNGVYVPVTYSAGVGADVVLLHHGNGGSISGQVDAAARLINVLSASGIIVIHPLAHVNNWGNDASLSDNVAIASAVAASYNVRKVGSYGHSMGGLDGLLLLAAGTIPGHVAFYGNAPVTSLATMYNPGFQSFIDAAYEITGTTPDTYAEKTAGHDPNLLSAGSFAGKYLRACTSYGDGTVDRVTHFDVLAAAATGTVEKAVLDSLGGHGDGRQTILTDILAFFQRAFGPATPTGFALDISPSAIEVFWNLPAEEPDSYTLQRSTRRRSRAAGRGCGICRRTRRTTRRPNRCGRRSRSTCVRPRLVPTRP